MPSSNELKLTAFRLTHPLPKQVLVAVSGGPDSMAALHWLMRRPDRVKGVVHLNHNTGEFSHHAEEFVRHQVRQLGLEEHSRFFILEKSTPPAGESPENYWRTMRYRFLNSVAEHAHLPVVLGHQLQDCMEEYLICVLKRGFMGTIPYRRGPAIRPFRLWRRESIENYCFLHNVPYLQDPMNQDLCYLRSQVRYRLLPEALQVNPGLFRIVQRLILKDEENQAFDRDLYQEEVG